VPSFAGPLLELLLVQSELPAPGFLIVRCLRKHIDFARPAAPGPADWPASVARSFHVSMSCALFTGRVVEGQMDSRWWAIYVDTLPGTSQSSLRLQLLAVVAVLFPCTFIVQVLQELPSLLGGEFTGVSIIWLMPVPAQGNDSSEDRISTEVQGQAPVTIQHIWLAELSCCQWKPLCSTPWLTRPSPFIIWLCAMTWHYCSCLHAVLTEVACRKVALFLQSNWGDVTGNWAASGCTSVTLSASAQSTRSAHNVLSGRFPSSVAQVEAGI
jgi:hypothetical protein